MAPADRFLPPGLVDGWPVALGLFPRACAPTLLLHRLDRAPAAERAGGGAVADPPSA